MKALQVLYITEPHGLHDRLISYLRSLSVSVVISSSYHGGLTELQRISFDVVILSCDFTENYFLSELVNVINKSNDLEIILVSEGNNQEACPFSKEAVFIDLQDQSAFSSIFQILKKQDTKKSKVDIKPVDASGTSLSESIPIGIYRIHPNGDILECNSRLVSLFGSPHADAVLGENFFSMFSNEEDVLNWKDIITRDFELHGLVYSIDQHDGETIWVRDTARALFGSTGEVSSYVGSLEDVTRQKRYEESISFLKTHDILTGLPNKTFFMDQARLTISQARYSGDVVAFLAFNLIESDENGSPTQTVVMNSILQQAAKRLKKILRKSDHVARLGEKSFIIMLSSPKNRKDILTVAEKITHVCDAPFTVEKASVAMCSSIGISIHPDHGDDIEILLNRSKIAALTACDREQQGGYMIYRDMLQHRDGAPFS